MKKRMSNKWINKSSSEHKNVYQTASIDACQTTQNAYQNRNIFEITNTLLFFNWKTIHLIPLAFLVHADVLLFEEFFKLTMLLNLNINKTYFSTL